MAKCRELLAAFCVILGVIALFLAAALWLYNDIEETLAAEYSEQVTQAILYHIKTTPSINNTPLVTLAPFYNSGQEIIIPEPEPTLKINETPYIGILSIPKIKTDLPVADNWNYEALRNTPCRYSGSIEDNNIVIAAHNYKKHFASIRSLSPGDLVIFTDVSGTEINYRVEETAIVYPSEADRVTGSGYDMTLFTCTYDETARVVVYINREE